MLLYYVEVEKRIDFLVFNGNEPKLLFPFTFKRKKMRPPFNNTSRHTDLDGSQCSKLIESNFCPSKLMFEILRTMHYIRNVTLHLNNPEFRCIFLQTPI